MANGSSLADGVWNHAYIQKQIREAAHSSLFDCWNWEGAIPDLNKTETDFGKITDRMLYLLNHYRLKKSIKTRANPLVLERVFQVILRRLADPIHNPPLKIAVFGGSVTQGVNSMANAMGLRENSKAPQLCTWACKLERLLNLILVGELSKTFGMGHHGQPSKSGKETPLKKVVVVTNYAVAGTDSAIGSTMLEYNLFGSDLSKHDIFISSFGANDIQKDEGLDRDNVYRYMQTFNRMAKAQRPCSDLPLVIQLDDILGDGVRGMTRGVREGLRYNQEMIETNNWAGFMSVSYADAVRDIVYAEPSDFILHEFGNLHPGFNFHTGVAWVMAYNLLEGIIGSCDAVSLPEHDKKEPRAGFPPPLLRENFHQERAIALWKSKAEEQSRLCREKKAGVYCVYSFVAATHGASTKEKVRAAINKVATNIQGWEATGFPVKKPRRTWAATGLNSTFTIQLDDLTTPINRMLILVSFGRLHVCSAVVPFFVA